MKLISWNVNGLRACLTHGFAESFAQLDADIFSVQETKMQPGQADFAPDGYTEYTYSAEKKGYSGTACWCREQPLSVTTGIGIEQHDHEGRVLTLEYPGFWLVNCYTPNSQDGLKRLDYRMEWEDAFRAYLLALDAKKPVILCGDLNVAHREIDIKNDKTNHMSAGFTDQERGKMTELLDAGFADSFRVLHPDEVKYSWWSYRFHAREQNAGWRIDYFLSLIHISQKSTRKAPSTFEAREARIKGCSPLIIPKGLSKRKKASRCAKTGCGAQRPLRALSGTRVLLTAAPTAPPCIRRRRRSSLLHFFLVSPICCFAAGVTSLLTVTSSRNVKSSAEP